MATIPEIAPYKGDGTTPLLQKWLDILWKWVRHVSLLGKVIDVTSRTSDYPLSVNETAKITITAASTPLNIAVVDGVYELWITFDSSTFGADRNVTLQPNGATQTNEINSNNIRFSPAVATDEIDVISGVASQFNLTFTGGRPIYTKATLSKLGSYGIHSCVTMILVSTNYERHTSEEQWTSAGDWTSLGTLQIVEAATGVCYVKRIS